MIMLGRKLIVGARAQLKCHIKACFSQLQYVPSGLVHKFSDTVNTSYATELNIAASLKLVSSRIVFKEALLMDAKINNVNNLDQDISGKAFVVNIDLEKIRSYLSSNNLENICGRQTTLRHLKNAITMSNQIILVTGGYSVGKSKILSSIKESFNVLHQTAQEQSNDFHHINPQICAIVNGRGAGNQSMSEAITQQLNEYPQDLVTVPIIKRLNASAGNVKVDLSTAAATGPSASISASLDALTKLQKKGDTSTTALDALLSAATNSTTTPLKLLIVDEANRLFTPPEAKTFLETGKSSLEWEVVRKSILDTLQVLVKFSKECGKMSVVISTFDPMFPFALERIGFGLKFFDVHIVVSEPSPAAALDTVKKWGVGDNLARALVDVFGGHLAMIANELVRMNGKQISGEWQGKVQFGLLDTRNLQLCLEEARNRDPRLEELVLRTLRPLALTGFVPMLETVPAVRRKDLMGRIATSLQSLAKHITQAVMGEESAAYLERQMAELLIRYNIAGYIDASAKAEFLPEDRPYGLVPATQFVRMLLVREFGPQWMMQDARNDN